MSAGGSRTATIRVMATPWLASLIPRYLGRCGEYVAEMRRALDTGEMEAIRFVGHRLAGSGGGYGFAHLSELGCRIEAAAMEGDTAECRACAEELETFLGRVEVVYAD